MTFIRLTKCGPISRRTEAVTRVAVSDISRYEQPDTCYPTDLYLKSGASFCVQESPGVIDSIIEEAHERVQP